MLLWYGFKIFLRYGLPWLIARFVRNQQAKHGQYQQTSGVDEQEGDVRVKKDPLQKTKDDSDFGEYVDFEDVND